MQELNGLLIQMMLKVKNICATSHIIFNNKNIKYLHRIYERRNCWTWI